MSSKLEEVKAKAELLREFRKQIDEIVKSNKPQTQKVNKCLNLGNVYCAITGDDCLIPPKLREARASIASHIPAYIAANKVKTKDGNSGQESLF